MTITKGIGNGIPLAAVVTTPKISNELTKRVHFNTFGGNPISCAAGKAVLEVIDNENLQCNSQVVGSYIIEGLTDLRSRFDIIGDVRGKGLMIGVELVRDRKSKEPAKKECLQVFEKMKNLGLLVGKGGFHSNVLRIKPPMCISADDADFIIEVFKCALKEF